MRDPDGLAGRRRPAGHRVAPARRAAPSTGARVRIAPVFRCAIPPTGPQKARSQGACDLAHSAPLHCGATDAARIGPAPPGRAPHVRSCPRSVTHPREETAHGHRDRDSHPGLHGHADRGGDRGHRPGCPRRGVDPVPRGARGTCGHREDAGDRRGDPGGRLGVPEPAVPHAQRLRRPGLLPALPAARLDHVRADRALPVLRRRRGVLRCDRLLRHVAGGPGQRARGSGRTGLRRAAGDAHRLPDRWRGWDVHRRPGPVRRRTRGAGVPGRGAQGAGGLRLRRRAAGHVHACRRRDLHQGRRRRCRPGRQGRGPHPRGRPAQRRHHRRQRGRQRR